MEIVLEQKPKSPIIINGFPGFGLVGTIATEFLLEHLETKCIGHLWLKDIQPMIAIHEEKVVHPMGLFYNSKYNLLVVHVVAATSGIEWKLGEGIMDIAKQLNAKEIISLEGVSTNEDVVDPKTFFFASDDKKKQELVRLGLEPLKEGIILGVTSALLLKSKTPTTCIFVETHSNMPDSKAAAKIVETLDKYLGLDVDYDPLLKKAEIFEDHLRGLLDKTQETVSLQEKKKMSYVG